MSREAARATTKSKMELSATKYNGTVVNLGHRKSHPRLHKSPRFPQIFLKHRLKLL